MRTLGFFHGYSVHNDLKHPDPDPDKKWPMNAEFVYWGDPAHGLMGRIPTFLKEVARANPQLLIWATTATKTTDGRWESRYAYDLAIERLPMLQTDFPDHFKCIEMDGFGDFIVAISHIEDHETNPNGRRSVNTGTSIELAVPRINDFFDDGPGTIFHTTSEDHQPRADRDMLSILRHGYLIEGFEDDPEDPSNKRQKKRSVEGLRYPGLIMIEGVPAFTPYGPSDVSETRVDDTGGMLVPKSKTVRSYGL